MLRALFLSLVLICPTALPVMADIPRIAPRPLASALRAMQAGRWDVAARLAARDGPAAEELMEWYRLRAGLGTPAEILEFLEENSHWPGLNYLRRQCEEVMTHAGFDDVLAFYDGYAPQTGTGVLNYARALTARGQAGEAEATVVLAWRTMDLSTPEHDAFLDAYGKLLKPHHAARLDMALWRGLRDVNEMLPLVPDDLKKLSETRQMIENGRRGLDALIAKLPQAWRDDPGIAHALFNRYIKRNKKDDAIALILRQSRKPGGLGEPERWASWRRVLARGQMRQGNAQTAYDLAAVHQLVEGTHYADLEWLAGYIALIYLDEPELALDHFQRLQAAVVTPISLGRAGYWMGRALEAAGDAEGAGIAYAQGAKYQSSFYGILAAEKVKKPYMTVSSQNEPFADWRPEFVGSDLFQVGALALSMGRLTLAERFFVALSDTQDTEGLSLMGAMLDELNAPHMQVMIGKAAAQRGIVVPEPYYPLHPLTERELPVPAELALAIARRESEFDPGVVSGAGAQGLMQVMPGTARDVARELELDHEPSKVLSDWQYNVMLGAAYLARLAEQFDGNIIMIAAGYNAGPGRPAQWIERFGDPRARGGPQIVDWIEHIPFRETRNYVMRVSESLPVYRARLGKPPLPVPFSEELTGRSVPLAGN